MKCAPNNGFADLALAVSRTIRGQPAHIGFIVVILAATIVFCTFLVRLGILMTRGKASLQSNGLPVRQDRAGFAQPVKPLRVFLARDEELGNAQEPDTPDNDVLQTPTLSSPPPAYGRWRCSVVCTLGCSARLAKLTSLSELIPIFCIGNHGMTSPPHRKLRVSCCMIYHRITPPM